LRRAVPEERRDVRSMLRIAEARRERRDLTLGLPRRAGDDRVVVLLQELPQHRPSLLALQGREDDGLRLSRIVVGREIEGDRLLQQLGILEAPERGVEALAI